MPPTTQELRLAKGFDETQKRHTHIAFASVQTLRGRIARSSQVVVQIDIFCEHCY